MMAYAFSKIENLVQGEEPNDTDIFGGVGSQDQQKPSFYQAQFTKPTFAGPQKTAQENKQAYQPKSTVLKTTTSGDMPTTPKATEVSWKGIQQGDSSGYQAALDADTSTHIPRAFTDIQQQVADNQAALQQRADEYVQNYQDVYDQTDYGRLADELEALYADTGTANIERSPSGDLTGGIDSLNQAILDPSSEAYLDYSRFLQPTEVSSAMVDPASRFEGARDFYVDDVNMLGTDAGLANLASRGMGPQYSRGMSDYDVMLMKRDPSFQNLINQIQSENIALETGIRENPEQLEEDAADYGLGRLQYASTQGRNYLTDLYGDLVSQNEAEAQQYRDQLQGLIDDKSNIAYQALYGDDQTGVDKDVLDAVSGYVDYQDDGSGSARYSNIAQEALDKYDPRTYDESGNPVYDESGNPVYDENKMAELISSLNLQFEDPSQYSYTDFLDDSEASQMTNIGGLMGTGKSYTESLPLSDDYTLDERSLQNLIESDIATARRKKDIESIAQRGAILGDIEGDLQQYVRDRSTAQTGYETSVQDAIDNWIAAQEGGVEGLDLNQGLADPRLMEGYNKDLVTNYLPQAQDFLTQDQVDELTALNADMYGQAGFGSTYDVGQGIGGDLMPDVSAMIDPQGNYAGLSVQDKESINDYLEKLYGEQIQEQKDINAYVPPYQQRRWEDELRGRLSAPSWVSKRLKIKSPFG